MEHPRTTIGIIKKKDNIPLNLFFGKKYYNYSVRQSLAFTKDYIHQNKVLNFTPLLIQNSKKLMNLNTIIF